MTEFRPRRSVLYMPGANDKALEKAKSLPTDAIIFDTEDSVSPDMKSVAREKVAQLTAVAAHDENRASQYLERGHPPARRLRRGTLPVAGRFKEFGGLRNDEARIAGVCEHLEVAQGDDRIDQRRRRKRLADDDAIEESRNRHRIHRHAPSVQNCDHVTGSRHCCE